MAVANYNAWKDAPAEADLFIPSVQTYYGRIGCFGSARVEVWGSAVRIKNDGE